GCHCTRKLPAGLLPWFFTVIVACARRPCTGRSGSMVKLVIVRSGRGSCTVTLKISRLLTSLVSFTVLAESTVATGRKLPALGNAYVRLMVLEAFFCNPGTWKVGPVGARRSDFHWTTKGIVSQVP